MKLRGTSSAFSDIIHIAWALLRDASLPEIQSRLYASAAVQNQIGLIYRSLLFRPVIWQ